jgi:competence protein ComEC
MVAPLILVHFGSIPLMSPVANLIAAPLVAAATVLAAIGVAIFPPLTGVASLLAQSILVISRGASGWPQVGLFGLVVTVVALAMAVRLPRFRVQLLVGVAIVVVLMTLSPLRGIPGPGVVVLNVGQGDAILVSGGEGRFALVDGGPDPMLLVDRMENYGVDSLDLIVATHVHADHVTGLGGLLGEIPVNRMWMAAAPHSTAGSDALLTELARWGIPVETPMPGDSYQLGALTLHVEGPLRRYASPNDQSIVLTVEGPSRSMLLTGDIETYAQAELAHLKADVLKVPHQGAATSDADWLVGVGAELAVISVGTNSFGHPADWVIEVLAESGTEVVRTDEGGDIVVPLD